ncbi:MAG: T9SS type A sorting domain-containing protein [Bacteroidales bacterium]
MNAKKSLNLLVALLIIWQTGFNQKASNLNESGKDHYWDFLFEAKLLSAKINQKGTPKFFQNYGYWDPNGVWEEIGPVTSSTNFTKDVGRLSCIEIDPENDSIILAGSPSGGLYYTLNKGDHWINAGLDRPMEDHGLNMFTPGIASVVITHRNDTAFWIVATGDKDHTFSYSRGVIRSVDYGKTWQLFNGFDSLSLPGNWYYIRKLVQHPHNPNIIFAATSRGVYKTTNALVKDPGDVQWTRIIDDPISNDEGYFELEFHKTNPGIMILSKEYRNWNTIAGDEILISEDGGETWSPLPGIDNILPTGKQFSFFLTLIELTPDNPDIMYLYIKGKSIGPPDSAYYNNFQKYSFNDSSYVQLGNIHYQYGNGRNGFAASPKDENEIYAATVPTYRSDDGGKNWMQDNDIFSENNEEKLYPHLDIQDIKYNKEGTELWAASDGGPFMKVIEDTVWINKVNSIGIAKILRFDNSKSHPDRYLFGGWDVGSQLFNKTENTWGQRGSGDGYGCVFDNEEEGTFYTVGYLYDHNSVRRYTNWEEANYNKYGNFWHANLAINPVNHKIIYMSQGDKVERSSDQGETWETLVTPEDLGLDPINYLLWDMHVAEGNGNYLYLRVIRINQGEHPYIFKTNHVNSDPKYITWTDITPEAVPNSWLTDIEVDYQNPDKIWASFNNTQGVKIMEYNNEKWSDITGNLESGNSGVYAVAHLYGSDGGLFAGSYYGIFFREDTSSDWKLYKPGLPNVEPVDIKINYKSGKLVTGTDGRGLWETDLPSGYETPPPISRVLPEILVYPNPAKDHVNIEYELEVESEVDIEVYDLLGRKIKSTKSTGISGQFIFQTQAWYSGLYIALFNVDGKIKRSLKFAVAN